MQRRIIRLALLGLSLAALAGCAAGSANGNGDGSGPVAKMVLSQQYREGGITVTVTRYQAPVDPASTPITPDHRLQQFTVISINCTLTNTTSSDLDVETRIRSTASGGGQGKLVDNPPDAINRQDMVGVSSALLDAANLVRAGATVRRTVYFQVDPDLTVVAFYLNTWTPGAPPGSTNNLPALFTLSIPA